MLNEKKYIYIIKTTIIILDFTACEQAVTNGNKLVYQNIPAALESSIETYSFSIALSFEGHAIHALFLLFSFQVEILTPFHASSLPFLQI